MLRRSDRSWRNSLGASSSSVTAVNLASGGGGDLEAHRLAGHFDEADVGAEAVRFLDLEQLPRA